MSNEHENDPQAEDPSLVEGAAETRYVEVPSEEKQTAPEETTQASDEGEEEEPAPLDLKQPKVSMEEGRTPDKPLEEPLSLEECIPIMRESYRNIAAIMQHQAALFERLEHQELETAKTLRKQGKAMGPEDGNPWLRTVLATAQTGMLDDQLLKATEREGSHWTPSVKHGDTELRPGQPRQKLEAGAYSDEELLSYLTKRAGVGTTYDWPLWHSGIWLRFRAPSLSDIAQMNHTLQSKRVELGTSSKGLAFSNSQQTLLNVAVNFALQFVIESNIEYKSPTDLEDKIDAMDAPLVLLGFASTMYPSGLPYAMPCVADPSKCQEIVKALLMPRELIQVDELALTQFQKNHMARRFRGKVPADDLVRYKNEHRMGRERIVWFGDVGLRLGTPSLLEQREAGELWINGIIEMTQGAFNEPEHGQNRNRYINHLGNTTSARQYAHWVKAVLERDDDTTDGYRVVSESVNVVNGFLDRTISDPKYLDDFFTKVTTFIEETIVAMVAVKSYNCPSCDTPTATEFHKRFEHLVPLDMLTLFFTLASRKLS